MKQALIVGVAVTALLALPSAGWTQAKTDYSGTWTFDQAKSDPPPARIGRGGGRGGGGTVPASLTITQTASQITIDRAVPAAPTARGATASAMTSAVYKLDGSESTNALGDVFLSRSKASWDGANLLIVTTKDMGLGPNGQLFENAKEIYSLAGGVLTVTTTTYTTPTPTTGAQTRKLVYNKKM